MYILIFIYVFLFLKHIPVRKQERTYASSKYSVDIENKVVGGIYDWKPKKIKEGF